MNAVVDSSILLEAKDNYENALTSGSQNLPEHGTRWGYWVTKLNQTIKESHSIEEVIRLAQEVVEFDHRQKISQTAPFIPFYEDVLCTDYNYFKDDVLKFCETKKSLSDTTIQYNGRLVSNVMYWHIHLIFACLNFKRNITSVMEIGGGYGNIARLWMTNPIQDICRYTIVDIPESLYFAEVFLRKALPDCPVIYINSDFEFEKYSGMKKAVFLCPTGFTKIAQQIPTDCLFSSASMGEMNEPWLEFWVDFIEKQSADIFCSWNYFGTPIENLFECENAFSPRVPPNWSLRYFRTCVPLFIAQSGGGRKLAEIIFERQKDFVLNNSGENNSARMVFESKKNEKFGLDDLLWFSYSLFHSRDIKLETALIRKIIEDFRYLPAALLFLVKRIRSHQSFQTLDASDKDFLNTTYEQLNNLHITGEKAINHLQSEEGLIKRILTKLPNLLRSIMEGKSASFLILSIGLNQYRKNFKLWPFFR